MEVGIEIEQYMKNGFKLLRRTKDPNSVKQMLKHFEDAIQEQFGGNRRPTNAAKRLPVPTALLSKELGIEQIDVRIRHVYTNPLLFIAIKKKINTNFSSTFWKKVPQFF